MAIKIIINDYDKKEKKYIYKYFHKNLLYKSLSLSLSLKFVINVKIVNVF